MIGAHKASPLCCEMLWMKMQVLLMAIKLQWVISYTLILGMTNFLMKFNQKPESADECSRRLSGRREEWFSGLSRLLWTLIGKKRNREVLASDQQQGLCCLWASVASSVRQAHRFQDFRVSSQSGALDTPRRSGGSPGCCSHLARGRLWTLPSDLFLSDCNFSTCGKWAVQSLVNYVFSLNTFFTVLSF